MMTSDRFLLWSAFITGLSVMAVELAASRLLAPYFGTSILVWTNLIAVVLAGLSLGYWLGGRIADRRPEPRLLYSILITAGLFLAAVPWLMKPLAYALDDIVTGTAGATGIIVSSLFATLLLFGAPMALLGIVSPLIIKLRSLTHPEVGSVAGSVFAISTVGSILGTFLPALWLIPWLGTRLTIFLFAVLLMVTGLIGMGRWRKGAAALAFFAVVGAALNQLPIKTTRHAIYEDESSYQYIQVVDSPSGLRSMRFDGGAGSQSVRQKDGGLTHAYFDYFTLLPTLLPEKNPKDILVIGVAGGTVLSQIERFFGEKVRLYAVELDPQVVNLARRYFNLQASPERIAAEDGRMFLRRTEETYDGIIVDAYSREYHIPWILATREFF